MNVISGYQLVKDIEWNPITTASVSMGKVSFSGFSLAEGQTLCIPISVLNLSIVYHTELMPIVLNVFKELYQPKNPLVLEEKTRDRQLSPLHIAVISGNQKAVELLIDSGVSVNAIDRFEWTPIHHAALLGHNAMLSYLLEHGADGSIKTNRKATYHTIQSLVYPSAYKLDKLTHLFWRDSQGHCSKLTNGEYQQKSSAQFLEECRVTQSQVFKTWSDLETEMEMFSFKKELKLSYENHLQNPLSHILTNVTQNSSGKVLQHSPGLGVYAKDSILAGQVLGEYLGKLTDDEDSIVDQEYLLNEVDGKEYRNEIAQINDGFCNTTIVPMYNEGGLSIRYILIAVDAIRAGEQFCWDYGLGHSIKKGPYIELRGRELRDFVKKNPVDELIKCYNKTIGGNCSLEELSKGEKFFYLMNTPSVLFSLTLEGVLSFKDSIKVQNAHIKSRCEAGFLVGSSIYSLSSIAGNCRDMHKFLLDVNCPRSASFYLKYVSRLPEKEEIVKVLNSARDLNNYISGCFSMYGSLIDELFLSDLIERIPGEI